MQVRQGSSGYIDRHFAGGLGEATRPPMGGLGGLPPNSWFFLEEASTKLKEIPPKPTSTKREAELHRFLTPLKKGGEILGRI